jgi:hypothetical protein
MYIYDKPLSLIVQEKFSCITTPSSFNRMRNIERFQYPGNNRIYNPIISSVGVKGGLAVIINGSCIMSPEHISRYESLRADFHEEEVYTVSALSKSHHSSGQKVWSKPMSNG